MNASFCLRNINISSVHSCIILVNRGWVPRKYVNRDGRREGNIDGITELVGVVRKGETRPQFSPKSTGEQFLYRYAFAANQTNEPTF